jgi:hypothetical protein
MTDAPGDYDAVYIDVQDVLIKSTLDNNDGDGWVRGVFNLKFIIC